MLKAGIFLDIENLSRNGGWGMRFDVIKKRMCGDGHLVAETETYVRSRRWGPEAFAVWHSAYAVRATCEDYNREGRVLLDVVRP